LGQPVNSHGIGVHRDYLLEGGIPGEENDPKLPEDLVDIRRIRTRNDDPGRVISPLSILHHPENAYDAVVGALVHRFRISITFWATMAPKTTTPAATRYLRYLM
jgi:hypothetical protein